MPNVSRKNEDSFHPVSKATPSKGVLVLGAFMSVTITPVAGIVGALLIAPIKGIWAKANLSIVEYQLAKNPDLRNRVVSCGTLPPNDTAAQRFRELMMSKYRFKDSVQESKEIFTASLLAMIPFIGTFAVGAFFISRKSDLFERSVQSLETVAKGQKCFVQSVFFPLQGGAIEETHEDTSGALINFKVNRGDDEKGNKIETSLNALIIKPNKQVEDELDYTKDEPDYTKPTMVLFHSNASTIYSEMMTERTSFYTKMGMNVVLASMAGYPSSGDKETRTSEISVYQDANAIIEYLKSKGAQNVGVHGVSIGGALAFAAAELHPDVVKLVVADQTFSEARDVGVNLVKNKTKYVPGAIVRDALAGGFPVGEVVPGVKLRDGSVYKTDGLNNASKAAKLRESGCELYAIKTKYDEFMGSKGDAATGYTENFSDILNRERYGAKANEHPVLEILGTHCDWLNEGSKKQTAGLRNQVQKSLFPEKK